MISRPLRHLLLISALLAGGPVALAVGDDLKEASRLYQQGQTAQALDQINTVLATKPRDAQARFLKGVILTEQKKNDEAIKVFTGLTEDYPELPEPYNNLAVLYASLGQYDRAKTALELAIRTHPSYATAHENLGDIYAQLASRAYDKALQLDKSNITAQTKLSMIKEIFGSQPTRLAVKPAPAKPEPVKPTIAAASEKPVQSAADTPTRPAAVVNTKVIISVVEAWAKAWAKKDVPAYLAFYAPEFETPNSESREDWEKLRTERINNLKFIQVGINKPRVTLTGPDEATVVFRQNYRSNKLKSAGSKTLRMTKTGDKWLIKSEKSGG